MKTLTICVLLFGLAGCMSPYKVTDDFQNEKKNLYVVTKDTEIRSLMGTNGGADVYELCQGPEKNVLFYLSGDFKECKVIAPGQPLYTVLHHKQSQGSGPTLLGAAMITGGLAVSGGANAAANATASATNTAVQTVIGGKHRR